MAKLGGDAMVGSTSSLGHKEKNHVTCLVSGPSVVRSFCQSLAPPGLSAGYAKEEVVKAEASCMAVALAALPRKLPSPLSQST